MSAFGFSFLHSLRTSSLSRSCHSGYTLSKNIVHVSKCDVVSCPAKKNVLHSSMISSTHRISSSRFSPCSVEKQALSITPRRSSPYPFPSEVILDCIICMSVFLNLFSSFHLHLFLLVGRYLQSKRSHSLAVRLYQEKKVLVKYE
ncbi:Os03g0370850 [Oryza sativa Japonica Group]|uniref:Os03g0370850 protein n=1 Tax=Oryza sativa subsp. japonica TaxID=39947 RepID=C7J0C2_ORYSJ|nr:Os03g0370850 [Oryza sativa Japonica Group]|eukprot:NP_001173439.1 Os03g0370850 [Oryza sativa Japonica Group]